MTRVGDVGLRGYRALYGDWALEPAPGVVVLRAPEAPGSPMLNRLVGLASSSPTEALVDEALAAMGEATFYVAVDPGARPPALDGWLAARGLARSSSSAAPSRRRRPRPRSSCG